MPSMFDDYEHSTKHPIGPWWSRGGVLIDHHDGTVSFHNSKHPLTPRFRITLANIRRIKRTNRGFTRMMLTFHGVGGRLGDTDYLTFPEAVTVHEWFLTALNPPTKPDTDPNRKQKGWYRLDDELVQWWDGTTWGPTVYRPLGLPLEDLGPATGSSP